jgi:hypothetical protein
MPKLYKLRITHEGWAAMEEAKEVLTQRLENAEQDHGEDSVETANHVVMLATAHYVSEAYEKAEPLFIRYLEIIRENVGPVCPEMYEGLTCLVNFYITSRYGSNLGSSVKELRNLGKQLKKARLIQIANNPAIESLCALGISFRDRGDRASLRLAVVLILIALSWCVTCYKTWHPLRIRMMPRLEELIMSLGLDQQTFRWLVLSSHHRDNDFIGLLSVIDEEDVFSLKS